MDNSKINQSELNYSCSAGEASVNLFTGRLRFIHPDISIGISNFQVSVAHIYNSMIELPTSLNTSMGKGWKLNIQQYLFYENNKYIYIDSLGYRHEFAWLSDSKYYDTTGLGLTLQTNLDNEVISDENGNLLFFENEKIIKMVSGENDLNTKTFTYYDSGKLESVYDNRTSQNKIYFYYDEITGLLNKMVCKKNGVVLEEIGYFYDSNKCLVKITRTVNGITKIDSLYRYYGYNLGYAVGFEDKSLIKINYEYPNNKVSIVSTGIANLISNESNDQQLYYIGDNLYCGDNIYLGETNKDIDYTISGGANVLGEDKRSYNDFLYYSKYTVVTNENNVKMVYFFNEKGLTISVFEANNGDLNDLRTLSKMPGISMITPGTSVQKINNQNAYYLSTNTIISTSNLMSSKLSDIKKYRDKTCNYFKFYNCSFWIKLCNVVDDSKIEITVESGDYLKETFIGKFDGKAVDSWQLVSIPIKIFYEYVKSISIKFLENSSSVYFYIADIRLCYNRPSELYITNGTKSELFDKITKVKYTPLPVVYINDIILDITNDFYITMGDLQRTYLSRFKSRGNADTGDSFVLSCCDGTKRFACKNAWVYINDQWYNLDFGLDDNNGKTRARFFISMISPDNSIFIKTYFDYIKDQLIGTKTIDCIHCITKATKYTDDKTITSHIESYTDLKGKTVKEVDEYDIETIYDYDSYGNFSKKTIQYKYDTSEKIIITSATSSVYNGLEDYKSDIRTYYNDPLGYLTHSIYKGKGEIGNSLTTNYTYDIFKDNLLSVDNNLDNKNYMRYGGGKLLDVTPTGWDKSRAYGYDFGYNDLGELNKYYLSYINLYGKGKDLFLEKEYDYINNKIITKKYRSSNPDVSTLQLDKYQNAISIQEGSKITSFTKQNINESSAISKITEISDSFDNKTYKYSYDDFNNINNYEVINSDGSLFLQMTVSSNGNIHYNGMNTDNVLSQESQIIYQEDKLLNPRISSTKSLIDGMIGSSGAYTQGKRDETSYTYDNLGRIKRKTHKIFDGILGAYTSIIEEYTYKTNTLLINSIKTTINNPSSKDTVYEINYTYDSRGNFVKSIISQKYGGEQVYRSDEDYTYDQANRVKSETKNHMSLSTSYTYNVDGTIDTETFGNFTKKFVYDKGRLSYFYVTVDPQFPVYFGYDRFGNCTHYMREPSLSPNMEWERGNLLKKYIGTNITASYSYNHLGIRTKKVTSDGKTIEYYLDGEKILAERRGKNNIIRYLYDIDGIKGFKLSEDYLSSNKNYPFYYVKDAMNNVIAILDKDKEVARYEYDAWGNCIILKDVDGIATLNPIRWKSYYYDNESGLYYTGNGYYSPTMRQFISPCNIDEIMYNIDVPGSINPYIICNPIYLPAYGYSIFTVNDIVLNDPGSNPTPRWLRRFILFVNTPAWYKPWTWTDNMSNLAKVAIGIGIIIGLGILAALLPSTIGVIMGAAFYGAVNFAISGIVIGAIIGGLTGGWKGMLDGAIEGFVDGAIMGGISGALLSGINIATGGVKIIGSAQKTKYIFHRFCSNVQAGKFAMQVGRYSTITLDRSLKRAGLVGRKMPDVIAVARVGQNKLLEVVSISQTVASQQTKVDMMLLSNPNTIGKVIGWAFQHWFLL